MTSTKTCPTRTGNNFGYILLQLVHTGENSDYTRRRASVDDLGANADALINQLTRERLLVSNQDKVSGNNTLEVAHEALIRDWPQFQQWLNEDRDFLLWRERLRSAREEWQRSGDPDALLDGQRLLDAKRWLKLKQEVLSREEQTFIRRSISHLRWVALRTLSLIIVPLALVVAFFIWSGNNGLSSRAVWYVFLAKAGIYTLQPEMVAIPPDKDCQKQACEFLMGSTESDPQADKNEQPQHLVRFNKAFAFGRYEVTIDEFQVFAFLIASEGGCANKNFLNYINDSGWKGGMRPVINVSWQDAQCYAQWLSRKTGKNYHLSTEAQWEYAARAGTKSKYYWDDVKEDPNNFSWFAENSDSKTHPVGEKKPNAFGLYDTAGNVFEWVEDCWHENYRDAPTDGKAWQEQNNGDCSHRVLRGSSWDGYTSNLRSANRARVRPSLPLRPYWLSSGPGLTLFSLSFYPCFFILFSFSGRQAARANYGTFSCPQSFKQTRARSNLPRRQCLTMLWHVSLKSTCRASRSLRNSSRRPACSKAPVSANLYHFAVNGLTI